ncbi:MAG: MATE family efflux transporter [Lachnospiraceae bacterium]|nr:MATE family efflux transporter [Lachnospiraceae bacterium]
MLKDRVFLSTLITLAIPITLQNFITSSLNLVDNLMIGKLGETAIAAVGLANQYFFIFLLAIGGVNAGANVFMAQYWGKRDLNNIKKMLGINLSVGGITAMLFGLCGFLFPHQIMGILSKDAEVIALGAQYMRIVSVTTMLTNITQGYSTALRSTEQPNVPMFASLIGVLSNAFLNWVLIFGKLGCPAMGVAGAAIATTIARVIEMSYVLYSVYGKKNLVASGMKEMFSFGMPDIRRYFKVSTSAILNELVWSIGMTAYSMAYAQIGTNAVATMQIATTLNNMFVVIATGLGVSSAIMVGNKIGSGEEETAHDYSKKIAFLAPLSGVILGICVAILAPFITALFKVQPATINATINVLRIMAVFAPLRFFSVVMIIGVFRGGGDTRFTMLLQLCTVWFYAVPLAFLGATVLGFSIEQVFFLICTEEVVKIFFVIRRLSSGKWLRNVVDEPAAA